MNFESLNFLSSESRSYNKEINSCKILLQIAHNLEQIENDPS